MSAVVNPAWRRNSLHGYGQVGSSKGFAISGSSAVLEGYRNNYGIFSPTAMELCRNKALAFVRSFPLHQCPILFVHIVPDEEEKWIIEEENDDDEEEEEDAKQQVADYVMFLLKATLPEIGMPDYMLSLKAEPFGFLTNWEKVGLKNTPFPVFIITFSLDKRSLLLKEIFSLHLPSISLYDTCFSINLFSYPIIGDSTKFVSQLAMFEDIMQALAANRLSSLSRFLRVKKNRKKKSIRFFRKKKY